MGPEKITGLYHFHRDVSQIEPVHTGHINDTYRIYLEGREYPEYILQRLNGNVFKNIPEILENISTVDHFIRNRGKVGFTWPGLIKTNTGEGFTIDKEGNYWRCYEHIRGTRTYENPADLSMAGEAGRIIGSFHFALHELPADLHETIPNFHDFPFRWGQFEEALGLNFENRTEGAKELIDYAKEQKGPMESYFRSFEQLGIPERPVHYDTKFNNILFDNENKAVSLIDLDTLMKGYIQFDYGDALRTLASTAAEDEEDPCKVDFDTDFFEAFYRSYFKCVGDFLTKNEVTLFIDAPAYLTFIIGLRFLTDYLNGDVYFKVSREGHNLIRARNQFRLVEHMIEKRDFIKKVIYDSVP